MIRAGVRIFMHQPGRHADMRRPSIDSADDARAGWPCSASRRRAARIRESTRDPPQSAVVPAQQVLHALHVVHAVQASAPCTFPDARSATRAASVRIDSPQLAELVAGVPSASHVIQAQFSRGLLRPTVHGTKQGAEGERRGQEDVGEVDRAPPGARQARAPSAGGAAQRSRSAGQGHRVAGGTFARIRHAHRKGSSGGRH